MVSSGRDLYFQGGGSRLGILTFGFLSSMIQNDLTSLFLDLSSTYGAFSDCACISINGEVNMFTRYSNA